MVYEYLITISAEKSGMWPQPLPSKSTAFWMGEALGIVRFFFYGDQFRNHQPL
jgi:hypothetical protein